MNSDWLKRTQNENAVRTVDAGYKKGQLKVAAPMLGRAPKRGLTPRRGAVKMKPARKHVLEIQQKM